MKRDKLFLFANYEGYRQNLGEYRCDAGAGCNARAGLVPNAKGVLQPVARGPSGQLLNLWPVANGPEVRPATGFATGIAEAISTAPQHIREDFGTTRLGLQLSAERLLFCGVYGGRFDREHALANRFR